MQETQQTTQLVTETATAPVATPTEAPQTAYNKKKAIFRMYQVIWYVLGVVEVLLGFRFVLKALGANPASGFTDLIYSLSNPLVQPFRGIFPTAVAEGSVFEWSTIVAAIVYLLVAYGLVKLFQLVKPTTPQEVEEKVSQ